MRERREAEDAAAVLEQLAVSALRGWGTELRDIRLIKMRENAVFRVVDSRGNSFALRIHREGNHSDDALRSELAWMAALQEAGIDVPTIVPTLDGRLFVTAHVDGLKTSRQVDLIQWIDARPLGTSEGGLAASPSDIGQAYRTIGNIAARLHNQAVAWSPPPGFRRPRWDLEGLVGEQPLWGRFWDLAALTHTERSLLIHAREQVRRALLSWARSADSDRRYSLIHADLVPENILVSAGGAVRVIDFDDCGFGWHLFELATALYFIQDDPAYELARASLISGYREHRDLPDTLLDTLPVFMAARAFTYLGWVHTRPGSKEGQAITSQLVRLACRQAERLQY